LNAASTTQKQFEKAKAKSTAADNNNGEKSQSRNEKMKKKNERSSQVGRTNPQTKTTELPD